MAGSFSISKNSQPLQTKEVAQLCLLGLLSLNKSTLSSLFMKLRELETATWQPTVDVLMIALQAQIKSGFIKHVKTDTRDMLSLSHRGSLHFHELIERPLPKEEQSRSIFLALKTYFVEITPLNIRNSITTELTCFYKCQLQGLQNGCDTCPLGSNRKQMQNEKKLRHIEEELLWLEKISIDPKIATKPNYIS